MSLDKPYTGKEFKFKFKDRYNRGLLYRCATDKCEKFYAGGSINIHVGLNDIKPLHLNRYRYLKLECKDKLSASIRHMYVYNVTIPDDANVIAYGTNDGNLHSISADKIILSNERLEKDDPEIIKTLLMSRYSRVHLINKYFPQNKYLNMLYCLRHCIIPPKSNMFSHDIINNCGMFDNENCYWSIKNYGSQDIIHRGDFFIKTLMLNQLIKSFRGEPRGYYGSFMDKIFESDDLSRFLVFCGGLVQSCKKEFIKLILNALKKYPKLQNYVTYRMIKPLCYTDLKKFKKYNMIEREHKKTNYEANYPIKNINLHNYVDIDKNLAEFLAAKSIKEKKVLIKSNPYLFGFIDKPSIKMCNYAVNLDGLNIRFVRTPTKKMCLDAMKQNPYSFCFIKRQSEDLCEIAFKGNKEIIFLFDDKFKEIFLSDKYSSVKKGDIDNTSVSSKA
jgi:hypothetical protein